MFSSFNEIGFSLWATGPLIETMYVLSAPTTQTQLVPAILSKTKDIGSLLAKMDRWLLKKIEQKLGSAIYQCVYSSAILRWDKSTRLGQG